MIDVGHPFSKPFQSLVDALVESLQLGVEQPASQEIIFRAGTLSYPLKGIGPVSGLAAQITGFVAGRPTVFTRGQHYLYAVGQLVWQGAAVDRRCGYRRCHGSRTTILV
jgi:hypothetical protein